MTPELTASSSSAAKLPEVQILWFYLRPMGSETVGMGSSNPCFNKVSEIFEHTSLRTTDMEERTNGGSWMQEVDEMKGTIADYLNLGKP